RSRPHSAPPAERRPDRPFERARATVAAQLREGLPSPRAFLAYPRQPHPARALARVVRTPLSPLRVLYTPAPEPPRTLGWHGRRDRAPTASRRVERALPPVALFHARGPPSATHADQGRSGRRRPGGPSDSVPADGRCDPDAPRASRQTAFQAFRGTPPVRRWTPSHSGDHP